MYFIVPYYVATTSLSINVFNSYDVAFRRCPALPLTKTVKINRIKMAPEPARAPYKKLKPSNVETGGEVVVLGVVVDPELVLVGEDDEDEMKGDPFDLD